MGIQNFVDFRQRLLSIWPVSNAMQIKIKNFYPKKTYTCSHLEISFVGQICSLTSEIQIIKRFFKYLERISKNKWWLR